jgi:hypothetical protein
MGHPVFNIKTILRLTGHSCMCGHYMPWQVLVMGECLDNMVYGKIPSLSLKKPDI